MSLEKNILEKIERDHLEVIPRWKFVAREYGVRCLAFIFFALGSVSWGAALYWVARHDRIGMYNLPYFWGALAAFFVAGIVYLFDKSDSLYKIRWTFALSSIGVLVFAGGYLSHATGAAKQVEETMTQAVPIYESMSSYQKGLGEAAEIEDEKDELETIVKNEQKNTLEFKAGDDPEENDADKDDDEECDEGKSCMKGVVSGKIENKRNYRDDKKNDVEKDTDDENDQVQKSSNEPEKDDENIANDEIDEEVEE